MLASVIVFLISSATPTLDPELDALYQKLHAAPELSGREEKTAVSASTAPVLIAPGLVGDEHP